MTFQLSNALIDFLLSDKGSTWLERSAHLPTTKDSHLANLSYLRQHLAPDHAAAVLEQTRLRGQAAKRFKRAQQMLFTDTGLQQSTHPAVAAYRAKRFLGRPMVVDLGCGIGSDTLALAQSVRKVSAVDRDPVQLQIARHNTDVHGLSDQVGFIIADALALPFSIRGLSLFSDPGRRTSIGRRIFQPNHYEPPLALLWDRIGAAVGLAIKVGPGVNYEALPWVDEVEIISLSGEVKEATLWCNDLATPGVRRRATLLPSGTTVTNAQSEDGCLVNPVGRYLFEPDKAVIRAGLVRQIGTELGLWQLDQRIAYLSGDDLIVSPLVQGFEIEETLPFGLKPIRRRLRELRVGILEIKKRGVDLDPDAFRRRLKLRGSESKTLIMTRIGDKPAAFLCSRHTTREASETSRV